MSTKVSVMMKPVQLLVRKARMLDPAPPDPVEPDPADALTTFRNAFGGSAPAGQMPLKDQLTPEDMARAERAHPTAASLGRTLRDFAVPAALTAVLGPAGAEAAAPQVAKPNPLLDKANAMARHYLDAEARTQPILPKTMPSAAALAAEPKTLPFGAPESPPPVLTQSTRIPGLDPEPSTEAMSFAELRARLGL